MPTILLTPSAATFKNEDFPSRRIIQPGSGDFPTEVLGFDPGSNEYAYWQFALSDYTSGDITLTLFWFAEDAGSGNVKWNASMAAITPDVHDADIIDKELGTGVEEEDDHEQNADKQIHAAVITLDETANIDSAASGDFVALQIYRNSADTMNNDANLMMISVSYS